MMGLPDGCKSFKIGLAVWIQYRRVTDTQPRCRSIYHAYYVVQVTMKQYNKPRKSHTFFDLGFLETIPSPRLGFLTGVFLANHLASTDNLTRATKRQIKLQQKLTIHKKGP